MWHVNALDNFSRDLRYAARVLTRSPGFTLAALLALALGIGANTAMYSVVHGVMLRPLEVREPDRLVRVFESNPGLNRLRWSASVPNYLFWKEHARTLDLAAFQGYPANWSTDSESERLEALATTSSFQSVLGTTVRLGRWYLEDEQRPGQHRVAVLSEGIWKTRFGQDHSIIGRKLMLNGEAYEVIGVASEGLTVPRPADLWVPLVTDATANRGNRQYTVIGRLKSGVNPPQAQAELESIARGLETQFPDSNQGWSVAIAPLLDWLISAEIRTALLVLLGAVGMVLLIACVNVASLQLARAEARRKEIAIRAAMGAGSSRISRQLLTESLLLSLIGGALGVVIGHFIVGVARHSLEEIVPRANEISIDLPVLGFAFCISVLTGLLFGMTPIIQLGKLRNLDGLRQASRTSQPAPRSRLRASLVVAQLSLATLLLVGAGLLLQSFARMQGVSLGLDSSSVLTARVSPPRARYGDGVAISRLFTRLTGVLASMPGVESAGVSSAIPLGPGAVPAGTVAAGGITGSPAGPEMSAQWRSADAGFFAALRIPVLRGRVFGPEDDSGKRNVFVLSQQAARSLFGVDDPVGRELRLNGAAGEVVGVVGDIRVKSLAETPERVIYVPVAQGGRFGVFAVFVRTNAGAETAAALIRERLREIDPAMPAHGFRTMDEWIDSNSARSRIRAWTLALLAGVALTLGMVGIYGVLSYLVTLRRHEFGVRLALGAEPASLLRLVIGQGLGFAAAGILLGLAGAIALTRVLETLVFGVSTRDPMTFLGVAVLLLVAVLIACYAPARRAARSDPMTALRGE